MIPSLNVFKCFHISFSIHRDSRCSSEFNHPSLQEIINENTQKYSAVRYLGMDLAHKLLWTKHADSVLLKRHRFFFSIRLIKLRVPSTIILQVVISCILAIWLRCSLLSFPGLKVKDFVLVIKTLEVLIRSRGINLDACSNLVV